MPYAIRLPDGTLVENIPDDLDPVDAKAQIAAKFKLSEPVSKNTSGFGDVATAAKQGLVGTAKSLTDVFGAENEYSQKLGGVQQRLEKEYTPERALERQKREQLQEEAAKSGDLINEITTYLGGVTEAPVQALASGLASIVPYVGTGIVGGVFKLGAPTVAALNSVLGASQGAGSIKGSVYSSVKKELEKGGMNSKEAEDRAIKAQEYLGDNWKNIIAGAGIGAVAGRKGVEELLVPGALARQQANIIPRVATTVLKEAPIEGLQGGQQQFAENVALQQEGFDVPTFQGVAGSAARDAAVGAITAAPLGAIARPPKVDLEATYTNVIDELRNTLGTSETLEPQEVLKQIQQISKLQDPAQIQALYETALNNGDFNTVPMPDNSIRIQIPEAGTQQKAQKAIEDSTPDAFTPELRKSIESFKQPIIKQMQRFGLSNVGLKIFDTIENGRADGYYANKVIALAMDSPSPLGTLRHETVHALRELGGFKPNEWNVLSKKAKNEWTDQFIKNVKVGDGTLYDQYQAQYQKDNNGSLDGFDDYITEEAVAEAFRYFDVNGAPPGLVGNLYYRLKQFFETLRNGFTGAGFDTTDKIFTRVEQGKAAPTIENVAGQPTKYGLTTPTDRQDYEIVRKAQTRGLSNEQVTWELKRKSDGQLIRDFNKRKDAEQMLDVYTLPKEEVWEKYPELKPTEQPTKYAFKQTPAPEDVPQDIWDLYSKYDRITKMANEKIPSEPNAKGVYPRPQDLKREETLSFRRLNDAIGNYFGQEWDGNPSGPIYDMYVRLNEEMGNRDLAQEETEEVTPKKYALTGEEDGTKGFVRKIDEGQVGTNATKAGRIQGRGELLGGTRFLPASGRVLAETESLNNTPQEMVDVEIPSMGLVKFGPNPIARQVAETYMANKPYRPATNYGTINVERAKQIAKAYDEMKHEPNNPQVQASYKALAEETLAQWQAIKDTGLQVEFISEDMEDPYKLSPRLAIIDANQNNHLWVFPTDFGYGDTGALDDSTNPMLAYTDEIISGKKARVNDIFRIVHDYFGHIKDGMGFRAGGEENAWRSHVEMYSPLARPAMTVETRGQNSWVNFGPYAEFNKTANGFDTKYAPQKLGLLPDEFVHNGRPAETDYNPSIAIINGDLVPNLKGKPTVDLIGAYFDRLNEKPLDFKNKDTFNKMVQFASEEIKDQLKQENSGLDWYEQDIKKAFTDTIKVIPELDSVKNRQLFNVIAGIMSPSTTARDNWVIAAEAFQHYVKTGEIPAINPKNKQLWMGGLTSANKKKQLNLLNNLVKELGADKAVEWMYSQHPISEINKTRKEYAGLGSIGGKANDSALGLFAFGPKVGPFVSNLNGIPDVTVDKWMTRTFNRYIGRMVDKSKKIIDQPTEQERTVIKNLINEVAKNEGIKPYQAQSILWFYEQRLFRALGTPSPSYGFSDGASKFLQQNPQGRDRSGKQSRRDGTTDDEGRTKYSLRSETNVQSPELTVRPSRGSGKGVVLGTKQEHALSYDGIHYSNSARETLNGSSYGTGIRGRESLRLDYSTDPRIKNRSYFYIPHTDLNGRYLPPEGGLGTFKHQQKFDNILGPGIEMRRIYEESNADEDFNNFESAVIDNGYDGYASPNMGMMVILNHDNIPVEFVEDTKTQNKRFAFALQNNLTPDTFLTSDRNKNINGNLAFMPQNSPFPKLPIRMAVGIQDDVQNRGSGATHILRRIQQEYDKAHMPEPLTKDLLEDLLRRAENVGSSFGFVYRSGNNLVLHDALSKVSIFVNKQPDHFSINSMYKDPEAFRKYGNAVWRGRNEQPTNAFQQKVTEDFRAVPVIAGERGVELKNKPTAPTIGIKKRRVVSPQDIENAANETKKFSLKVREFSFEDLPTGMNRPIFVLKKGTEIYHGAHKAVAEQIKKSNELHAKPKIKSGGGILTEGELIWFGDKETAGGHSKSEVDVMKAKYDRDAGMERNEGVVFSSITDKDYKLVPRGKILTKAEVDKLNSFLKLPDYGKLNVGDRLSSAEYRAHEHSNSNTSRYKIENAGIISNSLAQAIRALGYDGVYDSSGIALTAENGIRLGTEDVPMQRYAIRAPQTEAFKRWFGSSKVVDKDGNPLVVYHGTVADISEFDKQAEPATSGGRRTLDIYNETGIRPFFLSESPVTASSYATGTRGTNPMALKKGANVIPAYVSIKSPLILDGTGKLYGEFTQDINNAILSNEYDGVIIKNIVDDFVGGGEPADQFIAFNPNQIKSATGNQGTFDATNPDIRYAIRAPNTSEVKRWFGSSKIVNEDGTPKVMYHGTAKDITEFRPKQANAIFLTEIPEFAESFSDYSEDYLIREFIENATPEQTSKIITRAIKQGLKEKDITPSAVKNIRQMTLQQASLTSGIGYLIRGYVKESLPTGQNILPVFVKAENPFDYENVEDIKNLYDSLTSKKLDDYATIVNEYSNKEKGFLLNLNNGNWTTIENPILQKYIRGLGYDGFYVKEGGVKNLAVYEPSQIKSATGNVGTFDIGTPDIRYSLNRLTTLQNNKTAGQKISQAYDTAKSNFGNSQYWIAKRNGWIDPSSGLAVSLQKLPVFNLDGELRADMLVRAKSQALNLIKNGLLSGIPVLNADGTIGIQRSENNFARSMYLADQLDKNATVKASGLSGRGYVAEVARILRGADILKEDARLNAEGVQQLAEAKIAMKEAKDLFKQGKMKEARKKEKEAKKLQKEGIDNKKSKRELQVTPAHIKWAEQQLAKVPEMNEILGIWKAVNNGLVDLWEEVGLLSKSKADEYRGKDNYIPLFKSQEDLGDAEFFAFPGGGLKSTKGFKQLKGSTAIRNIWENLDKHYAVMLSHAYENQTRRVAVNQLKTFQLAENLNANDPDANLWYKEDGKKVGARIENLNDLAAFQMMTYELGPLMQFFAGSTQLLRAGALINPMYWIKQLIRDPIHANLVAGSGIITPLHSMRGFVEVLMKNSRESKILTDRGVLGSVDSTTTINQFLEQFGKEKASPTILTKALSKIMSIHEASDAATRVEIYKKAEAKALKEGKTAEQAMSYAVHMARESINFSVHGNSPALNALRHSIPFFSAAINSLDTVYRAATGFGLNAKEKKEAQLMFFKRAVMMFSLSVMYAMLYQDDEEYKKLPDYVKDNHWLIPNPMSEKPPFIKIPTPFEIGFLFKTIPEALVRYMAGTSTGKEVLASYGAGLLHNLPANGLPVPQAIKPVAENFINFSFFTGRGIEGMSDQGLPVAQRGQRASEFAKVLSSYGLDKIGQSPAKIDNIIQGYFAELGTFSTGLASSLLFLAQGKEPPSKNIENMPFMKAFLTDRNVVKAISDFYELDHNAKEVATYFNDLKQSGMTEDIQKLIDDPEKKAQLMASPVFRKVSTQMATIRKAIKYYKDNQDSGSADFRRDKINELTEILGRVAESGYKIAEATGVSR